MCRFILVIFLLAASFLEGATRYSVSRVETTDSRWNLSGESVFAVTQDGAQFLPGVGLAVARTVDETGWALSGGLYLVKEALGLPFYGTVGYQFNANYRITTILGVGLLGGEFRGIPIVVTAAQFDWMPIHTKDIEWSLSPGIGSVYVVMVPTPYFGTRLVGRIAGPLSLHGTVRALFSTETVLLGSAGILISL